MSESNSKDRIEEIDFDKLKFVRIFTPIHIPEYLIDQVRDKEYTTKQFYEFQEIFCIQKTSSGPMLNPLNFLYVVVDEKKVVVGYLWGQVDPLTKDFIIQTFSMDKNYWGEGKAVRLLEKKVKEIVKECELRKIYWITNFPKHAQRYGFKRSKSILFEYNPKEECKPSQEECKPSQEECKSALQQKKEDTDGGNIET